MALSHTRAFFVLLLAAGSFDSAASEGPLELRVRDSHSGTGIAARIVATSVDETRRTFETPPAGSLQLTFPEGAHDIEITAPGFDSLRTRLELDEDKELDVTLWLDPHEIPAPCRRSSVASRTVKGEMLLHGHVVDGERGSPVGDALVRAVGSEVTARSDPNGRFELRLPVPFHEHDELPSTIDVVATREGYRDKRYLGNPRVDGDTHLIITLEAGEAEESTEDKSHKLLLVEGEIGVGQTPLPSVDPSTRPSRRDAVRFPGARALRSVAAVSTPPSSIRVGFDCSCLSCSTVQVFSLETYVQRGLNDEWIASWSPHSLRAGAIPYRSYAVWHVVNPLDANYDICSNTCCQVNDADTSSSTDSAVELTAGILLESSGSIFRAEYSAENNGWNDPGDGLPCANQDLSCGDGFAGSPSTGWPCLPDLPDTGHGCFGHGRGMCQWGSQRWSSSQGRLWNWIVDHYYNDNDNPSGLRSAYMTSPLDLLGAAPDPPAVTADTTFEIDLTTENLADLEHSRVLIGASLWSPGTGYIDDPQNDQPVSLVPGTSPVSRFFHVPAGTPDEIYDLVTALWLDVDQDDAISSADLPMVTLNVVDALEICSAPIPIGDSLRVARLSAGSVELTWGAVANATSYRIYRSTDPSSGFGFVGSTAALQWTDEAPSPVSFYEVASGNNCGESGL